MSKNALNKIRSVTIHYDDYRIRGFSFFDKDGARLLKKGFIGRRTEVLLEENEVIIGVKAKLYPGHQSFFN
jgi:hypothetical protein